jgi:kynurenine formamidase
MPGQTAVRYAAKYVGKIIPTEITEHAAKLDEAIRALKGRRLLIVVGDWHAKLSDDEEFVAKHEWFAVDSLERIVERAFKGSENDQRLLDLLRVGPDHTMLPDDSSA